MKPPSSAPAIPSSMVTTKPPGSRPGVSSFAIIPTTSPKTIQDRIPMADLPTPGGDPCKQQDLNRRSLEEASADDAFVLEQPLLAIEAAAIPREPAVRADHPVARDDHGDRIGTVGRADGPDRGGIADALRQLRIRDCGAGGRPAGRPPDALLSRPS